MFDMPQTAPSHADADNSQPAPAQAQQHAASTPETDFSAPPSKKLSNLATLWGVVRCYPLQLFLASFFLLVGALMVLIVPSAMQGIVDNETSGGPSLAFDGSTPYTLIFAAIVVIMAVSTALRFYFVTWLGERVVADIRRMVYDRLIHLSPEYFEENQPAEIVSRLTADTTLVQTIVGSSVSVWARNAIVAVFGTIWLFFISPKLMAIVVVAIPLVLGTLFFAGKRMRTLSRSSQDKVASIGAKANESLSALPVVQAFTREPEEIKRYKANVEDAFTAAKSRIFMRSVVTAVLILMIFSAIAAMISAGVAKVSSGEISGGEMLEFIMRTIFVAAAFGALSEVYADIQRAAGAAGRLGELLNAVSRINNPANPKPMPAAAEGAVRFNAVTFRYPSKPQVAVLSDFNLTIKPGETVALVGPSGAGKSTVLQLLLRFYDPQAGSITIDGLDLRESELADFRSRIAFVPQDTTVFSGTIEDNLRYGKLDASEDEIRTAARDAAALDFIEDMPDGFNTIVGDRGTRLSGGQRQRIAIARALLRDAPILLLDEATSALDAESEAAVQDALNRLMMGRTTLVIAHRLATVKKADRIIVMDKGKIVDTGTHTELASREGLYKRLADLQFVGT